MQVELTKMLKLDGLSPDEQRVVSLRKMHEEYTKLLHEEARRIQEGIVREGQIALETLQAIGRAQHPE
jgi:hypothetical protein